MAILFRPFGVIAPKTLDYFALISNLSILSVPDECIPETHRGGTKLDIYIFIIRLQEIVFLEDLTDFRLHFYFMIVRPYGGTINSLHTKRY